MADDNVNAQALVDALATLRNSDGTLQESKRKLALGALFSHLTESETIDLRLRLNALRKPGFSERLQAEIYYKILDYLSLEDAMNLRLVRLDWSKKFSSMEFCKEIVKRHFPAKYENYEGETKRSAKDEEGSLPHRQTAAESNLKAWLENVMIYRRRRARGQYESTSVYYHSDEMKQPQYCNGRVAHSISREILVVKSLRSDAEERFAGPQRDYFKAWWLSDTYILAINGDGRTIYAWPLEAPESQFREDPHTQHFPHTISDVTVRGNRAGLVLFNNEIYIWHIGQLKNPSSKVTYPSETHLTVKIRQRIPWRENKLCSLPMLLQRRYANVLLDIFFVCTERFNDTPDPTSPKTLRTRLRFYEYEDLELKFRYTLYLNSTRSKTDAQSGPVIDTLHDSIVGISDLCGFRKRVSEKDSSIVQTDTHMDDTSVYLRDRVSEFGPMVGSESDDVLFEKERSLILFDMDRKEFQCRNYHEPGDDFTQYVGDTQPEALIWRDQTLSPIYRPNRGVESPPEGITNVLVTATNHFQITPLSIQNSKIFWYGDNENEHEHEKENKSTPPHRTPQFSNPTDPSRPQTTAYHWIGPPNLARDARLTSKAEARHVTWEKNFEVRKVRGDDAFVVLFGRTGFVVWCFDPAVRLRRKDSVRDLDLDGERRNPFELKTPSSFQFCEQIRDERRGAGGDSSSIS
ncbi:hypothetical protein BKA61DRAFT_670334 [Leptodontidium sp. MPI-SDFR-AT-0119]|nr:hypothetical protein BKA61DRAFT_670334 [Leptodontidium sp. MPI-SDFR-AT-0119]